MDCAPLSITSTRALGSEGSTGSSSFFLQEDSKPMVNARKRRLNVGIFDFMLSIIEYIFWISQNSAIDGPNGENLPLHGLDSRGSLLKIRDKHFRACQAHYSLVQAM
jgi:hypothetical protein